MKTKSEVAEESRRVVESLYAAAINGDIATVFSLLDEDIVCHESPSLPYGKDFRGHAGMRELFGPLPKYLALEKIKIREFKFEVQFLINRLKGRDAIASEPLDRQVKVAWNELPTSHPSRTIPNCHSQESRT